VLRLLPTDAEPAELNRKIKFRTAHRDSAAVLAEVQSVLKQLHDQSYLEASVDTLVRTDSTFTALLHLGPPFAWIELRKGEFPPERLKEAGYRPASYADKPLKWAAWRQLQDKLLQGYENRGFPFARVGLQNIAVESGGISADIYAEPGPSVRIGKINTEGNLRLSPNFLTQFLGIKTGAPFDRSRILRLRQRLRELPFVEMKKDPDLLFRDDGTADVNLYLDHRKAGRFDFLIGVLPNSSQVGRMLITGTMNADLQNQFGKGERITAAFERLRPETQQLTVQANYPYVLQLPFSADGRFHLYKRDTTFLNLEYQFGAGYLLEGASYWKAFVSNRSSRLLTFNEARLVSTRRLPAELDVSVNAFGLETAIQRLDYRLNPRRGWAALLRASAGAKRIRPNSRIEALGLGELYDSLTLRSAQYRIEFSAERYFPSFSAGAVKLALQGGYLISNQPLYRNEQFRIGGNRLLRGFDEEFFFASNYTVFTAEYRLLLAANSYLYAFSDLARVEDRNSENTDTFFPYGFGAGIALETRAGLLGLSLLPSARAPARRWISARPKCISDMWACFNWEDIPCRKFQKAQDRFRFRRYV
jgi:outer membrane protein assembly factor BamA